MYCIYQTSSVVVIPRGTYTDCCGTGARDIPGLICALAGSRLSPVARAAPPPPIDADGSDRHDYVTTAEAPSAARMGILAAMLRPVKL